MKIRVVGDKLLVGLFQLAGVSGSTPATPDDTAAVIDAYLADPEVGVVLVGSSYAAQMGPAFRKYLQRRKLPMVLRVPDREDQAGCADEIREYLQKSLGIRL
jgi:vacuolar-type H+-ATPase subunit F/Vma7